MEQTKEINELDKHVSGKFYNPGTLPADYLKTIAGMDIFSFVVVNETFQTAEAEMIDDTMILTVCFACKKCAKELINIIQLLDIPCIERTESFENLGRKGKLFYFDLPLKL